MRKYLSLLGGEFNFDSVIPLLFSASFHVGQVIRSASCSTSNVVVCHGRVVGALPSLDVSVDIFSFGTSLDGFKNLKGVFPS